MPPKYKDGSNSAWMVEAVERSQQEIRAGVQAGEAAGQPGHHWRLARSDLYKAAAREAEASNLPMDVFKMHCNQIKRQVDSAKINADSSWDVGKDFREEVKTTMERGERVDDFLRRRVGQLPGSGVPRPHIQAPRTSHFGEEMNALPRPIAQRPNYGPLQGNPAARGPGRGHSPGGR